MWDSLAHRVLKVCMVRSGDSGVSAHYSSTKHSPAQDSMPEAQVAVNALCPRWEHPQLQPQCTHRWPSYPRDAEVWAHPTRPRCVGHAPNGKMPHQDTPRHTKTHQHPKGPLHVGRQGELRVRLPFNGNRRPPASHASSHAPTGMRHPPSGMRWGYPSQAQPGASPTVHGRPCAQRSCLRQLSAEPTCLGCMPSTHRYEMRVRHAWSHQRLLEGRGVR